MTGSQGHTHRPTTGVATVFSLLALAACAASLVAPKVGEVWGGTGIRMSVGADSATLELDCAHGAINAPFTVQADGSFDLTGHYTFEHGGPVPANEPPDDHPARYTGTIRGDRMSLTIALTDTTRTVGSFTLQRASQGTVLKCL